MPELRPSHERDCKGHTARGETVNRGSDTIMVLGPIVPSFERSESSERDTNYLLTAGRRLPNEIRDADGMK